MQRLAGDLLSVGIGAGSAHVCIYSHAASALPGCYDIQMWWGFSRMAVNMSDVSASACAINLRRGTVHACVCRGAPSHEELRAHRSHRAFNHMSDMRDFPQSTTGGTCEARTRRVR